MLLQRPAHKLVTHFCYRVEPKEVLAAAVVLRTVAAPVIGWSGVFIKAVVLLWFILFFHCLERQAGGKSHMLLWSLWAKKIRRQQSLRPNAVPPTAGMGPLQLWFTVTPQDKSLLLSLPVPTFPLLIFSFYSFQLRSPYSKIPHDAEFLSAVSRFLSQKHAFCSISAYRLAYISSGSEFSP